MTMYGAAAVNELGSTYLVATAIPQNLPAPVFGGTGTRAGTTCNPRHALITVENGDIRYRLDGTDVVEPFGILVKDGGVIDWTDPLQDFSAFIDLMSVVATSTAPPDGVLLNISWRD